MTEERRVLTFAWWNLHNFAHYDPAADGRPRWPTCLADYEAKRDQILLALGEAFGSEYPDLLAVCEITREAAQDLAIRLPAGYDVVIPPPYSRDGGFQVAVCYRAGAGFRQQFLVWPSEQEDVTEETRPMVPVQFRFSRHLIRFVACHWTSFDEANSRVARERLADVLRRDTYEFLARPARRNRFARHVVILGDLNEEPMSPIFEQRLIGTRDRASARISHWRDEQARRVRLYNAAWRYLGEQVAHGGIGPPIIGCAGTFFNQSLGWRTLDHLLVSGELLGAEVPFLDETRTGIVSTPLMRDADGFPRPFDPATRSGISDHFPIVGRLVLSEVQT